MQLIIDHCLNGMYWCFFYKYYSVCFLEATDDPKIIS